MATLRQKKAVSKVVENGGIVSQAMIAAGYSPNTAKTPDKLTKSKGWNELMEQYLPDKKLAKVHNEGLEASSKIVKDGEVIIEIPDYGVRHKYLDSAYKLKGSYAPEKTVNLNVEVEVSDRIKELASLLRKANAKNTVEQRNEDKPDNGEGVQGL